MDYGVNQLPSYYLIVCLTQRQPRGQANSTNVCLFFVSSIA